MENEINLDGTEWISTIPSVYFDTTSGLVEKLGNKQAAQYIAKIGLGTGTVIDLTINMIEDPNNPGKVIASTVVGNITYYISGISALALTNIAIGAALAVVGVATAPVWLTIAGVGVAVAGTVMYGTELKDWVYDVTYNKLVAFEEFDIYSSKITGTATKEEFILNGVRNAMDAFPD